MGHLHAWLHKNECKLYGSFLCSLQNSYWVYIHVCVHILNLGEAFFRKFFSCKELLASSEKKFKIKVIKYISCCHLYKLNLVWVEIWCYKWSGKFGLLSVKTSHWSCFTHKLCLPRFLSNKCLLWLFIKIEVAAKLSIQNTTKMYY